MSEAFHAEGDVVAKMKKNKIKIKEHPAIELCRKSGKDKLDLCSLKLSSLPTGLLDLLNLQYLYLENNQLSEIPTILCDNLKLLIWFDVRRNNLISLPENINQLVNLKHLLLEGNHIEELPVQLGSLNNLKALNLRYNPLTFPPDDIIAKGTQEILKFLRKYESKPEQVQNHFVTDLSERVRLLSFLDDDTELKSPRKRGSLTHRCPMVSFSRQSSLVENKMLNLLEQSVSSLELKDRTESYQKHSLPLVKPKSSRVESNKGERMKPMFIESERKLSTKRESRIQRDLDRASKRKLNEKTEKNVQAIKDKRSLDDWRTSKKSADIKNTEKNTKFKQTHEIVIPYGHDELICVKKSSAPVMEKKAMPEQRLADVNRLSLNEQLENRIKEHVQNIKNWRRNHSTDLISLEKELSETTENLDIAEQLQRQLQTKHSKEYRFRAFTGGDYSFVPTSYL